MWDIIINHLVVIGSLIRSGSFITKVKIMWFILDTIQKRAKFDSLGLFKCVCSLPLAEMVMNILIAVNIVSLWSGEGVCVWLNIGWVENYQIYLQCFVWKNITNRHEKQTKNINHIIISSVYINITNIGKISTNHYKYILSISYISEISWSWFSFDFQNTSLKLVLVLLLYR